MQTIGRSAPFAFLLCAAVYLFTLTRQLDFPRAPERLGPDVWPQAILVLLMIACTIGLGRGLLARRVPKPMSKPALASQQGREAPSPPLGRTAPDEPDVPSRYGLVTLGLLLFLAYPMALGYLGFLFATFLLMALLMLVGQWRHPMGVMAVSAAGTLSLFYVFRGLVYVSLPLGAGPFQAAGLWVAALLGMR
jgi:putative tricarboxylic transport membrane protein